MDVFSNTKFSMAEIAKATGREPVGVYGTSYGAVELAILFREGDDTEGDHEVKILSLDKLNKEHKLDAFTYVTI